MKFAGNVFDVWAFQRRPDGVVFLLLHTSVEKAADRVHYRGLKDGLRSVREYVTGVNSPAKELCLTASRAARSG
jgi:hypothetical protein